MSRMRGDSVVITLQPLALPAADPVGWRLGIKIPLFSIYIPGYVPSLNYLL